MRPTTLFTILTCFLIVPAMSEEPPTKKPSDFIPNTISDEARQFLMQGTPIAKKNPQTLEDWHEKRKEMEALGNSLYEASSYKYSGEAEVLSFQGNDGHVVEVQRMTPAKLSEQDGDKAIMHIHGGGFCVMSPQSTYCVCASDSESDWIAGLLRQVSPCSGTSIPRGDE